MTLTKQIHAERRGPSILQRIPYWRVFKGTGFFLLLCMVFSQCTTLSILAKGESQRPVIQVGADKMLFNAKEVSPEENMTELIKSSLPLLLSSTKYIPKALDAKCNADPQCFETEDKGRKAFGHRVGTIQFTASFILSVEYQPVFLKKAAASKPKKFQSGATKEYRITSIGEPKRIGPQSYTIEVKGGLFEIDSEGNPVRAFRDDRLVYLSKTTRPSPKEHSTLLQQLILSIRDRGYEITMIESILS